MNTIKHVLLKGNESFLDHTKSIALYGKLYWRKSNKKLNVGDIVYLFMSGKGHYQIRYKLEVTNTSVTRQDEKCWLAPFVPDNDCFEFTPVAAMYEGEELGFKKTETYDFYVSLLVSMFHSKNTEGEKQKHCGSDSKTLRERESAPSVF